MSGNILKKHKEELLKIYEKLSPMKKEEVLDFIKWIWREKPKKKVSLRGLWKGIDVSAEDIEAAKKSLFSFDYEQ